MIVFILIEEATFTQLLQSLFPSPLMYQTRKVPYIMSSNFCQAKILPVGVGSGPAIAQAGLCKNGNTRPSVARAASGVGQIAKTARPYLTAAAKAGVLGFIPAVAAWNAQSKP
jgi:hypothetical protein